MMHQTQTREPGTHSVARSSDLPEVRSATKADGPQIMRMCMEIHEEIGVSNVNWEKVKLLIAKGIMQQNAIIGVIGEVGAVEAMIYLQMSSMWYSDDIIIEELFNFVRPEYRASHNAKALIEFAKKCSLGLDLPLLIGIVSNKRTKEKVRLYSRRFGEPSGAFFLFNGKTGGA